MLIDADPQGSLTLSLGIKNPDELDSTLANVMERIVDDKEFKSGFAFLSVDAISALYNFNDEQKALLEELMSEEYNNLWGELLGASGQIIQSGSSFVGTGMFAWPFEQDQYISSPFGTRVDPISGEVKTHGGTDIAAPLGTPILAAADGVVVTATWHNSYGYYVKIKHDDTYSTLYAHCSALHVSAGQTVKQGQVIADCGSTGYSTGPHLHYEVIQNGVRVNALLFYIAN